MTRSRLVLPRVGSRRHPDRPTLGPQFRKVAVKLGVELYPWQRWVADVSLELVPRRRPGSTLRLAAGPVGLLVGRQQGKSLWTAARVVFQCMLPSTPAAAKAVGLPKVIPQFCGITGQDRIGALARWYEHCELIMASDLAEHVRKMVRKNGEECLHFHNGSSYRVITPSKTGARGLHLDLAVIDEALAHEGWLLSVIRPTMAQRDGAIGSVGAQLVIASNAGDERSTLLNDQRELGRRAVMGDDPTRCWFEWSAADNDDPYDEAVWKRTLPTLDAPDGVATEFIRIEAEGMAIEDFAREYLCRYMPRRRGFVIDPERWALLPSDAIPEAEPVVLAADATRERTSASVVAAARVGDLVSVEILESGEGAEWVAPFLIAKALRNSAAVIIDAYGPLASIIPPLERAGVVVHAIKVGDVVNAAQGFADLIAAGRLAHQADPRFEVAGVGRRKVGDRWCFSRSGDADISAVVAASFGVWAVESEMFAPPFIH